MLRNVQCALKAKNATLTNAQCYLSTAARLSTKATASSGSISRQSKIMNKLFGARIAGSKKRWVPTNDSQTDQSVVFKASQFGKPAGSGTGKTTARRMVVLNKLFMKHITDLLATGEASEKIVGRGMQVTRLKITQDFALINVYWLGNGNALEEAALETDLNACAGYIRHELSQLCLMGEVPRIKFLRDKKFANINEVESLLRNMDFGDTEEEDKWESGEKEQQFDFAETLKNDFYGNKMEAQVTQVSSNSSKQPETARSSLPAMRHDVLGLDHRDVMSKILTKMRKSQEAWVKHNQGQAEATNNEPGSVSSLERINQKLAESAANAQKFDAYIAKRRERKNTPERKKYQRADDLLLLESTSVEQNGAEDLLLTKQQRQLYHMEDYLEDDFADADDKRKL